MLSRYPVAGRPRLRAAVRRPLAADCRRRRLPQAAPAERPRIGLVLSGGGARGAAHVGVIRGARGHAHPDRRRGRHQHGRSHRRPVCGRARRRRDRPRCSARSTGRTCCATARRAATSSTGASRTTATSSRAARSASARARASSLPLGLVQGQKITQVLRTATLRVGGPQDFDKLPTPFRALATDLETGEPVVLRSRRPRHGDARQHVGAGRARARWRSADACWSTAAWWTTCR